MTQRDCRMHDGKTGASNNEIAEIRDGWNHLYTFNNLSWRGNN